MEHSIVTAHFFVSAYTVA